MSETVRVRFEGEILERKARRVRSLEDGSQVGWVSLNGRDTKIRKEKRKRTWEVVS